MMLMLMMIRPLNIISNPLLKSMDLESRLVVGGVVDTGGSVGASGWPSGLLSVVDSMELKVQLDISSILDLLDYLIKFD